MIAWPLLSWLVFSPWLGALVVFLLRRRLRAPLLRALVLLASLSTLALGACAVAHFDPAVPTMQLGEHHAWIAALNVNYHLGIDGLGLVLILLTGIVSPVALYGTLGEVKSPALHGALFLVLQGSALGVFVTLDFFPWFVFWELSLIPAFLLIKL